MNPIYTDYLERSKERSKQIEQHRVQLFTERNKFKDRAEALERQLYEQRSRSTVIIGVLLCIIVLLLGGYVLCLELMSNPSMMTEALNLFGNS